MNGEKPKSRVAWPSISRGGGDLNNDLQVQMRSLLNDFGIILEEEATKVGINVFVFPLYREFNLVGALTRDEVLYAITPSVGGLPTLSWVDWRDKDKPPKANDLANAVVRDLGWRPISTLAFSKTILDMNFDGRKADLKRVSNKWIEQVISEAERQARIVKIQPVFKGRDFLIEKDLCFVLMPFREPFFRLYENQLKPTLEDVGLRVMKSDDLFTTTEIIEDIWEYINKARIIVADVTGRNSNVFYELGIAHTVGKPVIILTQNENDIPFDLRHWRYFKYVDNENGWKKLRNNLKKAALTLLEAHE